MEEASEIRVNWTRLIIHEFQRTATPEAAAQFVEHVGTERLQRIDEAGPLEWLPLEVHFAVVNAEALALGPEEHVQFWRRATLASMRRPMFRPLIQGMVRVFSTSPADLVRAVPHGWRLIARHCGTMATEAPADDPHAIELWWTDIPRSL